MHFVTITCAGTTRARYPKSASSRNLLNHTPAAAVAYFVFNRPSHTRESFGTIRAHRPQQLFIVADGPRAHRPNDVERCREVRDIVSAIDWPCQVERLYSDDNLGCKQRLGSGLDWVFSHVERAIILEDDCVPHPNFFAFGNALLERYATDERVWHITGGQYHEEGVRTDASYYFSKYPHSWGWATWQRAWRHYDPEIRFWPQWRQTNAWRELMPDRSERQYWTRILNKVHAGKIDSWDYAWFASIWCNRGLTATPIVNLVDNIGIGADATHTTLEDRQRVPPVKALGPLRHPSEIRQAVETDRAEFAHSSWSEQARSRVSPVGLARAATRRIAHFFTDTPAR